MKRLKLLPLFVISFNMSFAQDTEIICDVFTGEWEATEGDTIG